MSLILPGDYKYYETLANIPLFWNKKQDLLPTEGGAIIYDSDTDLPRIAAWKETQEFLYDGEYDLRMGEIEDDDQEWDDWESQEPYEITDNDLKNNWEFLKERQEL